MQKQGKFGIYVNTKENKAVRINSPYWFPKGKEWVYLTDEVNATILKIRELAAGKKLVSQPSEITWGSIPVRD